MAGASAPFRQRFFAKFMRAADQESHDMYGERKRSLFAGLSGRVLEIGPGTGVNFHYLPAGIEWIGIEPNPAMHPFLREEASMLGFDVSLRDGTSAGLDLEDESVDAVISTLVLCSVSDLGRLLREIRRVLRPAGRFVFLEHVADRPGTIRRAVQGAVIYTPWTYFSDGCRPNREIGVAIENAGFSSVQIERWMQYGRGPVAAVTKPHIAGVAVR